jgi:hypothetical protein
MNITSGTPVQKGVSLSDIHAKDYVGKLIEEKFNGYTCITIKGKTGIEEGIVIFHNGNIVASDYEYYRYNKRYVAEDGLERVVNALLAARGIIDTFSLSSYQVQLIMTLNEDANMKNEIMSVSSLQFPSAFDYKYEDELAGRGEPEEKQSEREALLKKYGLSKLMGPKMTRAVLLEGAEDEGDRISKMLDKKAKK